MKRSLNRWIALAGWLVLMGVVWVVFVPGTVSAAGFAILVLTGPLLVIALSALWRSQQPAPSVGQLRAQADAAEAAVHAKK